MTERPLIAYPWEIKAYLAGRKTQFRRVVTPQPSGVTSVGGLVWHGPTDQAGLRHRGSGGRLLIDNTVDLHGVRACCPYGGPGSTLWVKETWKYPGSCWSSNAPDQIVHSIVYAADGARRDIVRPHNVNDPQKDGIPEQICRCSGNGDQFDRHMEHVEELRRYWSRSWPSIHMPRWASRITLEVTDVRVERLQSISEEDARAEGVEGAEKVSAWTDGTLTWGEPSESNFCPTFRDIWDSIHQKRAPWSSNPWVWVRTVKVIS